MRFGSWFLVLGGGLVGCAGAAETSNLDVPEESALEQGDSALLPAAVVAAQVQSRGMTASHVFGPATIALPKKLNQVKRAFRKFDGEPPMCRGGAVVMTRFLNARGEEQASLRTQCSFGKLTYKNGDSVAVRVVDSIIDVAKEPVTPGDSLWGIDEIEVSDSAANESKSVTDAVKVAELVSAVDQDASLDGSRPVVSCRPRYTVRFVRNGEEVASAAFACVGGPPATPPSASTTARFTVRQDGTARTVVGPVTLDATKFVAALP